MTKITIEQLTDVYQITCGDYKAIIHGNSNLQKEIESLFGDADLSQKGQDLPRDHPVEYHKGDNPPTSFFNNDNNIIIPTEKKPAIPVAKPGVTRGKVWNLLDDGFSISEIAEKLGLTESAIIYHEKSYVPKDVKDEIEDPDADYRPMLTGVIDTSTNYDGGSMDRVE